MHYARCCILTTYFSLTSFFVFLGFFSFAQSGSINLLPNEYPLSIKSDSTRIKNHQLQIQSIERKMPDSAIAQYWQTYTESLRIGYHAGTATALNKLGQLYYNKNLYDSARNCLDKALVYIKLSADTVALLDPLVTLGNIYSSRAHYELALDHYYEAIDVLNKVKDKVPSSCFFYTYYNIALSWIRLKSNQRAKDALDIMGKMANESGDSLHLMLYNSIAGCPYENPKKIIVYLNRALSYKNLKTAPVVVSSLYNNLAHGYMETGDLDSARYFVSEAFALEQKYPEDYSQQIQAMHSWDNLAHIYHEEGKYQDAERIWTSVLKEARAKGLVDIFVHIAPFMADNYNAMGRSQQAYDLLLSFNKIQDSINNFQRSRSTELWLQAYLEKKNKIVLEHELRLNKQENLIRTKNFWIGVSILGALLLVMMMIGIIRSFKHKQKLQAASMSRLQQEQEINQLKALVRGEQDERNRIAVELHDGIASELWCIKVNVGRMHEQERAGDFREGRWKIIYDQLNQAALRVRTTAHNLMPDLLLEEGLAPALSTLCQRMKNQTGLHINFQEYGSIDRINEEIELSVYRMLQELIQNALKHARGATQLLVQLSCTGHLLNITVEDNGEGFEEKNISPFLGFGLGNIKKRVSSLQGHFELKSQPGEGTTAYLEFDLRYLV